MLTVSGEVFITVLLKALTFNLWVVSDVFVLICTTQVGTYTARSWLFVVSSLV